MLIRQLINRKYEMQVKQKGRKIVSDRGIFSKEGQGKNIANQDFEFMVILIIFIKTFYVTRVSATYLTDFVTCLLIGKEARSSVFFLLILIN
jgi:hypothetical protein